MGLLKWIQKKGSTGGIVRTVIKQYKFLKAKNPDFDETEILELIFENRYVALPPKQSERQRHLFANADSNNFVSIRNLSLAIINIEMDVNKSDQHLYRLCSEIIDEEIKRLL